MFETNFTNFKQSYNITFKNDITMPKDFEPKEDWLTRVLLFRRKENMNTFLLVVGKPRRGKSMLAIKIAEKYCMKKLDNFEIEEQLTLDSIRKFLIWSKTAKDSIFIVDEVGTNLSTDQFWSLQSQIMRRYQQTQGFRRNVVIWVLPLATSLQAQFRNMCDYAIRVDGHGIGNVFKVLYDPLWGEKKVKGKRIPYEYRVTIKYDMPSEYSILRYLPMKEAWNNQDLDKQLSRLDDDNPSPSIDSLSPLDILPEGPRQDEP